MIAWQSAAAFVALVALAGPVLVHLLRRRRASRVAFPTVRFVEPSFSRAVRLRLPGDPGLLALRLAIVALAVCAAAQPVFVTPARLRGWNARIARAIVVDASGSMAASRAEADREASLETRSATTAVRVETADLGDGIRRAAAALIPAPPARREIVVLSDFQEGALDERMIGAVPRDVGLRFVRVGRTVEHREVSGPVLLSAGGASQRAAIGVEAERTVVAFERTGASTAGLRLDGVSEAERRELVAVVAASGVEAPSAAEPIAFEVAKASGAASGTPALDARWMLTTALRLRRDPDLRDRTAPAVGTSGGALHVRVGAPADSFDAAAALRGVLAARGGELVEHLAEHEVRTIGDGRLRAWSREAATVPADAWRFAPATDARLFWAAALLLLGVEAVARRRRP
jgi:hypothetical protein